MSPTSAGRSIASTAIYLSPGSLVSVAGVIHVSASVSDITVRSNAPDLPAVTDWRSRDWSPGDLGHPAASLLMQMAR